MNVHQTINLIIKEKDTDEYMQSEMEKQLHEQYAINNNANTGSIVTLFVAMLASVGAYGFVYLHTKNAFSGESGIFACEKGVFYMDALILTAVAVIIIFLIMAYLCVSSGCRQRMEQFVTYAIRKEYYKNSDKYKRIFPENYTPFGKRGWDMVQSPYKEFIYCIRVVVIAIIVSLMLKIFSLCGDVKVIMLMLLVALTAIVALVLLFNDKQFSFLNRWQKKIIKREVYYEKQEKE